MKESQSKPALAVEPPSAAVDFEFRQHQHMPNLCKGNCRRRNVQGYERLSSEGSRQESMQGVHLYTICSIELAVDAAGTTCTSAAPPSLGHEQENSVN
jgi:hypothetical protein